MKTCLLVLGCLLSLHAHAYTATELREDCTAAESQFLQKKNMDVYESVKGTRCISYVTGFSDGFAVGNYLAEKVGVSLNAICLPNENNMPYRLVRAVLAHLDRHPPNTTTPVPTLVAGALSNSFPCEGNDRRK